MQYLVGAVLLIVGGFGLAILSISSLMSGRPAAVDVIGCIGGITFVLYGAYVGIRARRARS